MGEGNENIEHQTLNILLINYEYPPIGGGAANATWHLAKELFEAGHRVTVLTAAYRDLKGWRNEKGIDVFRCPAIRKHQATSNVIEMLSFVVCVAVAVLKIVRKRKINGIIVFFLFPCGPIGLIQHLLYRIPYLISLRGGDVPGTESGFVAWIHRLIQPIRKLIYRESAGIVANSRGLKALALKSDNVDIHVIPNGVDTNEFKPDFARQRNGRAFQLLYVGRFQPEKNLPFLFRRLSESMDKSATPFLLHTVGQGPQEKELRQLAISLGLADGIVWHGWLGRSGLKALYRQVDCLVMPSRYEGMSNAILEAMACGLPVLASRVEGNAELVQEGYTGYLFGLNQSGAFKDAFCKMVENPKKTSQIGENARRFTVDRFSWKEAAEGYATMLLRASKIE